MRKNFIFGKLHRCQISYIACMSPVLNGSTAVQRFECGNTVEIRNGIMFDSYPGLPQMSPDRLRTDNQIDDSGSLHAWPLACNKVQ